MCNLDLALCLQLVEMVWVIWKSEAFFPPLEFLGSDIMEHSIPTESQLVEVTIKGVFWFQIFNIGQSNQSLCLESMGMTLLTWSRFTEYSHAIS